MTKITRVCFLTMLAAAFCFRLPAQKPATVNVTLLNNSFTHVDLVNAYGSEAQTYASADIDGDKFTMTVKLPNDIYRLDFGNSNHLLVVITPGETMYLTADAKDLHRIVDAAGTPAMGFVKDATDLVNRKSSVLDSLNKALQNDPMQKYWSSTYQKFNQFKQTNDDVDGYLAETFGHIDTLSALLARYRQAGKLKSAGLDDFILRAGRILKDIDNAYRPFGNYLENVDKYYDFRSGRADGHEDYFADMDGYLNSVEARHRLAETAVGTHMPDVKRLIAVRDSLTYNNLFDKKKARADWAEDVERSLADVVDGMAGARNGYMKSAEKDKAAGQTLVEGAQENLSGIVHAYQEQYNSADSRINSRIMETIRTHKYNIGVLMFLDLFPREHNTELHEEVVSALHEAYPDHAIVKERWNFMNSPGYRTAVGSMAPELAYPNPDGKIIRLSDLRGKVVILDFWASWCGPCRRESPNVRRVYETYHDKGLEVFSFSLDRDAASWKKAIADDKLVWPNHASDLKFWQSEGARTYGVRSIPSIFLINREGRIVAKDLRGQALEEAVKRLLNE